MVSLFCSLLLCSVDPVPCSQKRFNFMCFPLFIFLFVACTSGAISRKRSSLFKESILPAFLGTLRTSAPFLHSWCPGGTAANVLDEALFLPWHRYGFLPSVPLETGCSGNYHFTGCSRQTDFQGKNKFYLYIASTELLWVQGTTRDLAGASADEFQATLRWGDNFGHSNPNSFLPSLGGTSISSEGQTPYHMPTTGMTCNKLLPSSATLPKCILFSLNIPTRAAQ